MQGAVNVIQLSQEPRASKRPRGPGSPLGSPGSRPPLARALRYESGQLQPVARRGGRPGLAGCLSQASGQPTPHARLELPGVGASGGRLARRRPRRRPARLRRGGCGPRSLGGPRPSVHAAGTSQDEAIGAKGGTRTPTGVTPQASETCASTSSATFAGNGRIAGGGTGVNRGELAGFWHWELPNAGSVEEEPAGF